jgi:hypothetical protein
VPEIQIRQVTGDTELERASFTVEDIAYEVAFTRKNEFLFYVLPRQSRRMVYDRHELADWDYFGEIPERVGLRSEFVTTTRPVAVFRNVLTIVGHMLRKRRPHYFTFSANELEKMDLYTLVAHRIAQMYGYAPYVELNVFAFYRQAGTA